MNLHQILIHLLIIEVHNWIGTTPDWLGLFTGTIGTNGRTHGEIGPGISNYIKLFSILSIFNLLILQCNISIAMSDAFKLYGIVHLYSVNLFLSHPLDPSSEPNPELVETVSQVAEAESLDDYRPCRPEYFIGRYNTQREIWQFLDRVRKGNTTTRLLALTAQSGFGKSSLIIKLTSRFRNQKWKNKFYLYPVDSRSAKGPLFVAKALKAGFDSAINSKFVNISQSSVNIDSTEGMLKSDAIQIILSELKKRKDCW